MVGGTGLAGFIGFVRVYHVHGVGQKEVGRKSVVGRVIQRSYGKGQTHMLASINRWPKIYLGTRLHQTQTVLKKEEKAFESKTQLGFFNYIFVCRDSYVFIPVSF